MKIIARTTYTVNGGKNQTADIAIEVADDFSPTPMGMFALMNLAADKLVEHGQIMISGVEVIEPSNSAAA